MITVLCAAHNSNYFKIPGLDIYTADRDMRNFSGQNKVITHAPCAQWSRLHKFANSDIQVRQLAITCMEFVLSNGGIFEHPAGSSIFKYFGLEKKIISVNQSWWGFPCEKKTYLFCNKVQLLSSEISFNAIEKKVSQLSQVKRELTPLTFNQYLVNSIIESNKINTN